MNLLSSQIAFDGADFQVSALNGIPDSAFIGEVRSLLDATSELLEKTNASEFIRELTNALGLLKSRVGSRAWIEAVVPVVRIHPVMKWVHECPLTLNSYSRPRGYPGDAGLLDIIYRHQDAEPIVSNATALGKAVFEFTINVSACEAVRQRRQIIARRIDEAASSREQAEILAVACGHLREVELSEMIGGRIARFVATDQDAESLRAIETYTRSVAKEISFERLTVRDFIANKHELGTFDLIYAAGLYDYLDGRLAGRLTARLFNLLKPGGKLITPNFLEGIWELPYMEAYMNWHLISRSEKQIRAFAEEIDSSNISSLHYFADELGCIGYLELERA